MSHREPDETRRRLPAWLMGLIIAALLFLIGIFVFGALGFGDDPVIEQILLPNALAPAYWSSAARKDHGLSLG